jgi:hypothetical protein
VRLTLALKFDVNKIYVKGISESIAKIIKPVVGVKRF